MTNQWPEFDKLPRAKTVRSVLLEEGSGISERTDDKIRFVVDSSPSGKGFQHYCSLFVLQAGYKYPLLRVVQNELDYPLVVVADLWREEIKVHDEDELRNRLGAVFQSDPVKKLVPQLLELVT